MSLPDPLSQARSYIIEDIEILNQRVTAGRDRAIVRNLFGVVEHAQIDPIHHRPVGHPRHRDGRSDGSQSRRY